MSKLTSADILYETAPGRFLLKTMMATGMFRVTAWFMHTGLSKAMIPGFIKKNNIDMTAFAGQEYDSFASFFARTKETLPSESDPETFISPCDGLLSVFPITPDMNIPMKGSHYRLMDIVPDLETAESLKDGLCMVFRLQASDYHHFCSFDDGLLMETHFIPGLLHSVQPIAIDTVPVYRLNRRWWSRFSTKNFGQAVQVEVGAMVVGGVTFAKETGQFRKGEEMGNFELAGSTILLLLSSNVRQQLELFVPFSKAMNGAEEVPVRMAEAIGQLRR